MISFLGIFKPCLRPFHKNYIDQIRIPNFGFCKKTRRFLRNSNLWINKNDKSMRRHISCYRKFVIAEMARVKQTARKSTGGGRAPVKKKVILLEPFEILFRITMYDSRCLLRSHQKLQLVFVHQRRPTRKRRRGSIGRARWL